MDPVEPTPRVPDRVLRELRSPLTVIRGTAQLLARAARRCATLGADERRTMLARLARLETATTTLTERIERLGVPFGRGHDAHPGDVEPHDA